MTRLTRDTAKRSIADLFEELFRDMAVDGVVEVTRSGSLPPGGLAAMVKIEITKQPPKKAKKAVSRPVPVSPAMKTADKTRETASGKNGKTPKGPTDADVQGQSKPAVANRNKRAGRKKSPGSS